MKTVLLVIFIIAAVGVAIAAVGVICAAIIGLIFRFDDSFADRYAELLERVFRWARGTRE